jgi:hypothetical protein
VTIQCSNRIFSDEVSINTIILCQNAVPSVGAVSGGSIAGGIFGGLVVLALIVAGICCIGMVGISRHRKNTVRRNTRQSGLQTELHTFNANQQTNRFAQMPTIADPASVTEKTTTTVNLIARRDAPFNFPPPYSQIQSYPLYYSANSMQQQIPPHLLPPNSNAVFVPFNPHTQAGYVTHPYHQLPTSQIQGSSFQAQEQLNNAPSQRRLPVAQVQAAEPQTTSAASGIPASQVQANNSDVPGDDSIYEIPQNGAYDVMNGGFQQSSDITYEELPLRSISPPNYNDQDIYDDCM